MPDLLQQRGADRSYPETYARLLAVYRQEVRRLVGALSTERLLVYAPELRWLWTTGVWSQRFTEQWTPNQPRSFSLVRGAGDGGAPDGRRGKKQDAAGRGVQAAGE